MTTKRQSSRTIELTDEVDREPALIVATVSSIEVIGKTIELHYEGDAPKVLIGEEITIALPRLYKYVEEGT